MIFDEKMERKYRTYAPFSLSKKSSENWAFSFGCGKIKKKGRKSEGNAGNRTDEQR